MACVPQVVENTVNALLADYLRSKGLQITTEISGHTSTGRKQPDFYLRNSGAVFGEGEWEASFMKGLKQAHDYSALPDARVNCPWATSPRNQVPRSLDDEGRSSGTA